ncbi:MAG: MBL fold metallo-hydrolase [Bacillota bacterium]|nr:MBL fold metallo-hydrolase [Bacillota bacterium]
MKRKYIALILPVFLLLASCRSAPASKTVSGVEVHFIDVGQGDCILIRSGTDAVLIDAGKDEEKENVISYLSSLGIKKLSAVIGTHPHDDHIGSLDEAIKEFRPGTVIMPRVSINSKAFENVLTAVSTQGKKIKAAKTGLVFNAGDISLRFLSPPPNADFYDLNDMSAVIRMEYAGRSFLFCGDAGCDAEEAMLSVGLLDDCDVLKVGHHGSTTATSAAFLKAVSPEFAVISVGAGNEFSLPSKSVVKRICGAGIKIYRTDLNGSIVCTVTQEGDLSFECEKAKKAA